MPTRRPGGRHPRRLCRSGLLAYAHVQTPGEPWPTLGEMIDANRRLVVLTDDSHGTPRAIRAPGTTTSGRASPSRRTSPTRASDFSCADNRGDPGNDLFILNHFLTRNVGAPVFAEQVNPDPVLDRRALDCWVFQGRIPNFVTVDFYEIGSVLSVVDALNAAR